MWREVLMGVLGLLGLRVLRNWLRRGTTLDGKVVMVTGGTSGVGEQMVYSLLAQGVAKVIVTGRNSTLLTKVKAYRPAQIETLLLDYSRPQEVHRLMQNYSQEAPLVDILINNAGMGVRDKAMDCSHEFEEQVMNVNYLSHLAVTKALVGAQIRAGGAMQVVNVLSVQAKFGIGQRAGYCASKHALLGYMDSLRADLQSQYGNAFHICNVLPGYLKTDFAAKATQSSVSQDSTGAYSKGLSKEKFVTTMLLAMRHRQNEVVIDSQVLPRLIIILRNILPNLVFWAIANRNK